MVTRMADPKKLREEAAHVRKVAEKKTGKGKAWRTRYLQWLAASFDRQAEDAEGWAMAGNKPRVTGRSLDQPS